MDAVEPQVRKARPPLKVKTFKKFQISQDETTAFALELNRINDSGFYFGIHKSWKKTNTDDWKHANSVNLPISLWKNFLNVIPSESLAIGMYSEHSKLLSISYFFCFVFVSKLFALRSLLSNVHCTCRWPAPAATKRCRSSRCRKSKTRPTGLNN